ncbi:MAG: rod shape-determining protein RodA [Candidatus Omnitrophica bacterium]|nr:rod shape-determining protein RodA [Candidatus Omnitrophota bacterium]
MISNLIYKIKNADLFLIVAALCVIGALALHSASYTPNGILDKDFAKMQFMWILASLPIIFLVIKFGYEQLVDKAYILYGINIILLLLVLLIGQTRLGARRWLSFGFFFLQPSELCKVTFILALVKYVTSKHYKFYNIYGFIVPLILVIVPVVLIIKQPDLGTAITLLPIFFIVLFASGIKKRYLFAPVITAVVSSPFLWSLLRQYQKNRILVFLNPNMDPLGAGYTVIQSKIAVGSGGFLGKGWMSGTQNQLNFLPERHTDFIFSVIGEEWGFIGSLFILILFLLLFLKLLKIASSTSHHEGRMLVIAILALFWFQATVNIAMTMGLMPVTGLPLPFITYGGSHLNTAMLLIALAKSVELKRKVF